MQKQRTALKTILVIVALILVNPLGLFLMVTISHWNKWIKIIILCIFIPLNALWLINFGNFTWRFTADRQVFDANALCAKQCLVKSPDQQLMQQCREDCLKTQLPPSVYRWHQSVLFK